jgi:hypothetical protein
MTSKSHCKTVFLTKNELTQKDKQRVSITYIVKEASEGELYLLQQLISAQLESKNGKTITLDEKNTLRHRRKR